LSPSITLTKAIGKRPTQLNSSTWRICYLNIQPDCQRSEQLHNRSQALKTQKELLIAGLERLFGSLKPDPRFHADSSSRLPKLGKFYTARGICERLYSIAYLWFPRICPRLPRFFWIPPGDFSTHWFF